MPARPRQAVEPRGDPRLDDPALAISCVAIPPPPLRVTEGTSPVAPRCGKRRAVRRAAAGGGYGAGMPEEIARVGDVELAYETFGDRAHPAVLLVMGLATQMLGWRAGFCAELADRGFHVIRYDNRDVGRSTKFAVHRPPTAGQLLRRDRKAAAYTLADMADDGVGLLDGLGIDARARRRRVDGRDDRPDDRVPAPGPGAVARSIMSNTGARWTGQPSLSMYGTLLKRAPRDREGYIAHQMRTFAKTARPASRATRPTCASWRRELRPRARPGRRRPPARGDHRLRRPDRRPRADPRPDASSSTARRTSSSRPRAAGRPRRRSPARGS